MNARDIQRRADELAAELDRLSQRAANAATLELRQELAEAKRKLVAEWIRLYGSVTNGPQTVEEADRFVGTAFLIFSAALSPSLVSTAPLAAAWLTAYSLGVGHALNASVAVRTAFTTSDFSAIPPPIDVLRPVARVSIRTLSGLDRVAVFSQGFTSVTVSTARAGQAVKGIEASVAAHITSAASAAVTDVAESTGWARIWVAERDACLHCLAYAGHITTTGVFPTGLTFADRPLRPMGPLLGPPLHPHCRCVLELIDPDDHEVSRALKREAKRSVLRGFSLPSESEAARLRAAQRLLERGSTLPKSVKQYARTAVRRGEFPRGREVPTGG